MSSVQAIVRIVEEEALVAARLTSIAVSISTTVKECSTDDRQ